MHSALKLLCLSLILIACLSGLRANAQMTEVPFPEPNQLLVQRNQRVAQIRSTLENIRIALSSTYQQLDANINYLESNKVGLQQRLTIIGQVEQDLVVNGRELRNREIELGQRCPLDYYGRPMCPPQIFNPIVALINQLRFQYQQRLQIRQQRIYDHQGLFADTIQAVNRINVINQNLAATLASRQALAQELAQLSQIDPQAPIGFNFGNGEVANIKVPAALPAETRDLIEKAKSSLVQVDTQIEKAQKTSRNAEEILGATKRTLDNVKKTLGGTPASELDFGDL